MSGLDIELLTWGPMGRCVACRKHPAVGPMGYCGTCFWELVIEAQEGFTLLDAMLADAAQSDEDEDLDERAVGQ